MRSARCAAASCARELYALDGTERQDRPYTVTEASRRARGGAAGRRRRSGCASSFPTSWPSAPRSGSAATMPMTQFEFTDDYDAYGQPRSQTASPCRAAGIPARCRTGQPYLATHRRDRLRAPDDAQRYLIGTSLASRATRSSTTARPMCSRCTRASSAAPPPARHRPDAQLLRWAGLRGLPFGQSATTAP